MTWWSALAGLAYGTVFFLAAYVGITNFDRLWDD